MVIKKKKDANNKNKIKNNFKRYKQYFLILLISFMHKIMNFIM
ncbi:hypothetical protein CLH_2218 [Clostridium botulinum E3 str. Alaska E43]|nr:hypothetical protein CLH_2218 [Clostridium botulinum E3 str. Alaska E43]